MVLFFNLLQWVLRQHKIWFCFVQSLCIFCFRFRPLEQYLELTKKLKTIWYCSRYFKFDFFCVEWKSEIGIECRWVQSISPFSFPTATTRTLFSTENISASQLHPLTFDTGCHLALDNSDIDIQLQIWWVLRTRRDTDRKLYERCCSTLKITEAIAIITDSIGLDELHKLHTDSMIYSMM